MRDAILSLAILGACLSSQACRNGASSAVPDATRLADIGPELTPPVDDLNRRPPDDGGFDQIPSVNDVAPADAAGTDSAPELRAAEGLPETSLGTVSGSCGDLPGLFAAAAPALVVNTYAFDDFESFDPSLLGAGAAKRYDRDNQGGSSLCSEVMSIQLLEECEGALLFKTETEIEYAEEGSIADYIASLEGERVGVSVTRAYQGPMDDTWTLDDASVLLTKKLAGLHEASAHVAAADAWAHSLLHVWTLRPDWVPTISAAWEVLPADLKGDAVVMVTVEANSEWIVPEACKP